jgi:molybdenum cofactor cytidylyltransferase
MPSYQMRRGHPWVLPRRFWSDVRLMKPPQTMRDFHNSHARDIEYVVVETDSILQDLDTPEQYQAMGARVFPTQTPKTAIKPDGKKQGN